MSVTLNSEKALAAEDSKLMKIVKAIKKAVAKEFVWIVLIVILAFPLAYMLEKDLEQRAPAFLSALQNAFKGTGTFMILYVICAAGLYFSRMVMGAIRTIVKSKST